MKRILLLIAALFCLSAQQVLADSGDSLDIKLQLNKESVTINGTDSTGEAPYLSDSTTLVPMRVITTAFGATLQWNGETQTIVLKYGDKTIKLTIGSLKAEVNGKPADLPAAPELRNGTTMVPLRFISETFGADVQFDTETGTIKITGKKAAGAKSSGGTDINIDAGKTKIGNSYYQWSMKYPTGLSKDKINFREDDVTFKDANGEYDLYVYVEDGHSLVSSDALLKKLADELGTSETILDKKTVTASGTTYAKITSKYKDGYVEHRAYQTDERLYYIHMYIKKEEYYKNAEKSKTYTDLLDSFKTSFDTQDSSIKDLSTVSNGYRPYKNDDFGLKAEIPADWKMAKDSSWTVFYDEDNTQSLSVRMTSLIDKDTLEQWVARDIEYLKKEYLPDYITLGTPEQITAASGEKGLKLYYSTKIGDKWKTFYRFYFTKGNYKYELNLRLKTDNQSLADTIQKSIGFTDKSNSSLGVIDDDSDFIDKTKLNEEKFKKEKFAISIPHYWERIESSSGSDAIVYGANAGEVSIKVSDGNIDKAKQSLDAAFKQLQSSQQDFKLNSSTTVTLAGVTAYKWVYTTKDNSGVEITSTVYLVSKNDKLYAISISILKATSTEANLKMMQSIVDSFRFLD